MSTPRSLRIVEWKFVGYRRHWRSTLMSSFVQPLLYLLAMGLGVGALVNSTAGSTDALGGLTYIAFVAPGLLATTTMMLAANESLWPVHDAMRWGRQYEAISQTPLDENDIVTAHLAWIGARVGIAAGAVAIAMALFPEVRSWGLIAAVPAAMLGGLAFAMPIGAWTVTRQSDISFPVIQRFVITPLFLFGGAFFPITELPAVIRLVCYVSPLWHSVELCRAFVTSLTITPAAAALHIAYLVAWIAGGALVMRRVTGRRLFA